MPTHKNSRLNIWNDAAEVTKLYNNRWRVAIRCLPSNKVEDWYYANRGTTFAEFADAYDKQLDIDGETEGWAPSKGEAWLNALLIRQEMGYTPSGEYVVTFIYETLTESYVEDRKEEVDYELNGLRRVTRTLIAKEGTSYGKLVGDATITHTAIGYGSETLYLGSVDDAQLGDDEGGYTRIRETWLQAGQIFKRETNPSDGLKQITTGWWKTIGATVGPIIEKSTENFEGFEVFTVTTMNSPDGGDVTDGSSDKLVASFETLSNWTRPGILGLVEEKRFPSTTIDATRVAPWQQAPTEMRVRAHVEVYFSKNNEISDADFDSITGGTGVKYWNPESWAKIEGGSTNNIDAALKSVDRTYRGFRAITSDDAAWTDISILKIKDSSNARIGVPEGPLAAEYYPEWFGTFISALIAVDPIPGDQANGYVVATADIVGGPERPEGKIWIIDIQNPKAFTDVDGVDYYKKTYVWTYIPDFDAGEDIFDNEP